MVVTTTATDPVDAVFDILDGTASGNWSNTVPEVNRRWERTQKERANEPDPALDIWSPVEGTFDAFSGDYNDVNDIETVEVQVWGWDESKTADYASDVVNILSQYGTDNQTDTEFIYIRPQSISDDRAEHVPRQSDHYIASVQVEIRDLRNTGT